MRASCPGQAHCPPGHEASTPSDPRGVPMPPQHRERGAAAVEFALVLPVLLVLVMGIIDFGRVFSAQQTLTYAARSGARVMVLQNSTTAAITAAQNAASPLGQIATSAFSVSPS